MDYYTIDHIFTQSTVFKVYDNLGGGDVGAEKLVVDFAHLPKAHHQYQKLTTAKSQPTCNKCTFEAGCSPVGTRWPERGSAPRPPGPSDPSQGEGGVVVNVIMA